MDVDDLEHGDEIVVELEATVIEVFDDESIDVNLNDHGESILGGINLCIEEEEIKERK